MAKCWIVFLKGAFAHFLQDLGIKICNEESFEVQPKKKRKKIYSNYILNSTLVVSTMRLRVLSNSLVIMVSFVISHVCDLNPTSPSSLSTY